MFELTFAKFLIAKARYFSQIEKQPIAQIWQSQLAALQSDGILVIENFLDETIVSEMRAGIDTLQTQLESLDPQLKEERVWRIGDIGRKVPATEPFFDHPMLTALAKAYVGSDAYCSRKVYGYKCLSNAWKDGATLFYHFDDWKHRFKAMLYLSDTEEANGPFAYLVGSQRGGLWKLAKEYDFYKNFSRSLSAEGNDYWQGCYLENEVEKLVASKGFQKKVITAKAGCLIVFDSRGLHRGMPIKKGERKILNGHWKLPGGDGEANSSSADEQFQKLGSLT